MADLDAEVTIADYYGDPVTVFPLLGAVYLKVTDAQAERSSGDPVRVATAELTPETARALAGALLDAAGEASTEVRR